MSKSITPYNNKHQRHGLWERYWYNGNLLFKCFYHNGKEVGYDEDYTLNGKLQNGKLHNKTYHV
jgi:antitoxin component YwqK of YwqJK toxin-antitoxin module